MAATRGIDALERAGVEHRLLRYAYRQGGAVEAAAALGVEPARMLKSLLATAGDAPVFALVAADAELSLRKLAAAAAAGAKSARMADPRDAERITGYRVGGMTPLGARRALPVLVDRGAGAFERVCLNAGARGAIVEVPLAALVDVTGGRLADLAT
jgi:Cys-tRNA(Pro)/Cys-tRNA(Cys) deacylase